MTKEEILAKYGDVPLKFSSYYKYSFYYAGVAEDGTKIDASYGGSSDDICRHSVSADSIETLNKSEFMSIDISSANGEKLFSCYDY